MLGWLHFTAGPRQPYRCIIRLIWPKRICNAKCIQKVKIIIWIQIYFSSARPARRKWTTINVPGKSTFPNYSYSNSFMVLLFLSLNHSSYQTTWYKFLILWTNERLYVCVVDKFITLVLIVNTIKEQIELQIVHEESQLNRGQPLGNKQIATEEWGHTWASQDKLQGTLGICTRDNKILNSSWN